LCSHSRLQDLAITIKDVFRAALELGAELLETMALAM
jgi:hypothetical protein